MPPTLPALLGVALLVLIGPPGAATAATPATAATAATDASAASAAWRAPVPGAVLRPFHTGPDRFARGQHRGVDLAAPAGARVGAACPGRVSFAGRVPGGGRTVSVRCGSLVATYQHLGSIAVRRGEAVTTGRTLGRAGHSGDPRDRRPHVHLGAREHATGRYIDPLTLLGASHPGVPVVPPPTRAGPRHRPLGPAPRGPMPRTAPARPRPAPGRTLERPRRAPARAPAPEAARGPASAPTRAPPPAARPARAPALPWSAWAGLACLAAGVPLGALTRRRRRARDAVARPIARPAA